MRRKLNMVSWSSYLQSTKSSLGDPEAVETMPSAGSQKPFKFKSLNAQLFQSSIVGSQNACGGEVEAS